MADVAHRLPVDHASKARLRLWIRLLRCTRYIESDLRNRLRQQFGETLPRFDVLAALYRQSDGMMMSQLSRYLVVSNGNVTGIVNQLVTIGMVNRSQPDGDRRSLVVSLTPKGVSHFEAMASVHETWVNALLADIDRNDAEFISNQLRIYKS